MKDHHVQPDEGRPKGFEEVLGQEHPVRYLSGLIVRGRLARNLLLHGTFGAGKTSLMHIYARALNCDDPQPNGSPCGSCKWCKSNVHPDVGLFAFSYGESLASWMWEMNRTPAPAGKFKILFFDEAHLLTKKESDLLLQAVERPPERVAFCFATTEFENIRLALRSRLMHLEVKPLSVALSIKLLKGTAARKGYGYDPEALALLAALKGGHPRDLLVGLDQVADGQERVTSDRVRFVFDVDHGQVLTEYFTALGDGDLSRQTRTIFEWREPAFDKMRWVQAYLTSLYYNEVLRKPFVLDPLIEAMTHGGAEIIGRFLRRLGLHEPAELAPVWRRMMAFWPVTAVDLDETAVHLRLTLFHHLVNVQLLQPTIEIASGERYAKMIPVVRRQAQIGTGDGQGPEDPFPAPEWLSSFRDQDPAFLRVEDIRELINCVSFFVQEHGRLLNFYFEIRPSLFGLDDEQEARRLVGEFCAELQEMVSIWCGGREDCFAHVTIYEGAGDERRALIVAHLPHAPAAGRIGEVSSSGIGPWVAGWRSDSGERLSHEAVRFETLSSPARALRFHWDRLLHLCGGLSEDDRLDDPTTGEPKPLLDLLGVPKSKKYRRSVGPVDGPVLVRSASLSTDAMRHASRHHMRPLSAFDAQAWRFLRNGWEMQEHHDRMRANAERERDLRTAEAMFEGDVEATRIELEKLRRHWPADPERRRRSWTGWWARLEA